MALDSCVARSLARCAGTALLCLIAVVGCGKTTGEPTGTVLVAMADNSYSPAIVRWR